MGGLKKKMTPLHNNIATIRQILIDEIEGNIGAALEKMDPGYSMTWVYKRRDGVLFPAITADDVRAAMNDVYAIKDRTYTIKHIIVQGDVVMAELIESYPDPQTGKLYQTPLVIVWEFNNGKIRAGRHYCDPQLSYLELTEEDLQKVYK
jgi:ketosteroid isomerase-like protein